MPVADRVAYGFGWWDPVPKEDTLVNRVSMQRVRRVGPIELEDQPESEGWLRFEYRDDDIAYPILAHLGEGEYRHPFDRPYERRGRILTVDHNRSAALWRQEAGAAADHPPYGLWRRVDDCLTDALPCWPRMKSRDRALAQVRIVGGWLNGAWHEGFERNLPALTPVVRKRIAEAEFVLKAERPFIMPLDAEPLPRWRFHPFPPLPVPTGTPMPQIENRVTLSPKVPVKSLDNQYRYRVVPAGSTLTGMEERTPYMRATDGSRVLFAQDGTDATEERGGTHFRIRYADSDLYCTITAVNRELASKCGWVFNFGNLFGGCRSEDPEASLWVHTLPTLNRAPSYLLWQRLLTECTDAWLFWEGTRARCDKWEHRLALAGTAYLILRPNYLAGLWSAGEYCLAHVNQVRN